MVTPRYLEKSPTAPEGLRAARDLPTSLPYHLEPRDVFRLVEDLHGLLFEVNGQLVAKGYERLEELLDPAGFSGLVSRAVVDKMSRLSKQLVANEYHNGYPDLLPHGVYPRNRVQHGDRGGLEVKASRYEAGWQSHGPRAGWFLLVQFKLDRDEEKALHDRDPTRVLAAMVAELATEDWSWQPAKEGRIRSGTASVKSSGATKLRAGAVWVDPEYEATHQALLRTARRNFLGSQRLDLVYAELRSVGGSVTRDELEAAIAADAGLSPADVQNHVRQAIKALVSSGTVTVSGKGATTTVSLSS